MTADANHPARSAASDVPAEGPALFRPFDLGRVCLDNRIVVAPMCQYMANDGVASDWHIAHLVTMGLSGASLVMVEATGVERIGRITHGCLGLYSDACEEGLGRVLPAVRTYTRAKLGIQIGHAGRKASVHVPWRGGGPLRPEDQAWETVGPSAVPFASSWHTPKALDGAGLDRVRNAFVDAAKRAARLGFDVVELHGAHGYLLHQFFSPLSNKRQDEYGGSLENRMRFPLEIAKAVRAVWPADRALGARITGSDWVEGGATIEDAVVFAGKLKAIGLDYVCVSSGGVDPGAKIPVGPGYQVHFAREVKRRAGIATRAVGMIVDPKHANGIVSDGDADMIALARAVLDDPRWGWHAADVLGGAVKYAPSYERSHPAAWPGSRIARPGVPGSKKLPW